LQNTFNCFVAGLIKAQSPLASGFQPFIPGLLSQTEQPSRHREPVDHRVGQQTADNGTGCWPNIGRHHLAGRPVKDQSWQLVRRQMGRIGDALARLNSCLRPV
jgi:hypothetical protein